MYSCSCSLRSSMWKDRYSLISLSFLFFYYKLLSTMVLWYFSSICWYINFCYRISLIFDWDSLYSFINYSCFYRCNCNFLEIDYLLFWRSAFCFYYNYLFYSYYFSLSFCSCLYSSYIYFWSCSMRSFFNLSTSCLWDYLLRTIFLLSGI